MIRDFYKDLRASNNPELRKNWEKIFRMRFGSDCKIEWRDEISIQKGFGTDTVITTSKGRRYSVEVKTRNNNCYEKEYIMEIVSHIFDRKDPVTRLRLRTVPGWIYTTTAEYVFHGTLDKDGKNLVEVIFYSLVPFKSESYKGEFSLYKGIWLETYFANGQYQLTLNRLIPLDVIKQDAIEFWQWRTDGT